MNKLAIYILLILAFLGASRVFTPDSQLDSYIFNKLNYSEIFEGRPVTIILKDAYQVGFIIKSNIHRYRVVRVFGRSETVTVRVDKKYFQKTLGYIGLSLFRRNGEGVESMVPVPPGSLFIGDTAYGNWISHQKGDSHWFFFRHYQFLQNEFFWGDFQPDENFYRELNTYLKEGSVFTGLNNEFGSNGAITQSQLPLNWYKNRNRKYHLHDYIRDMITLPLLGIN